MEESELREGIGGVYQYKLGWSIISFTGSMLLVFFFFFLSIQIWVLDSLYLSFTGSMLLVF